MRLTIRKYLERGPSTSKEIQAATGLSQSSVARQIREMGDRVIQLKKGRSIRYAATCNAFGGNDKLHLSMVDAYGDTVLIAFIRPLRHGGFFLEPVTDISPLLLGENNDGLYDDLPYFLFDLRPQGFLGRQIAQEIASQSDDFPTNPRHWNTNHIGRYLISNGDDLPGNFKFGEQTLLRVRRKPVIILDEGYPALADSVMSGSIPGSSAGGEQPKFTALNSNSLSHVIVKFSPKGDNDLANRWRDILITEYHAAKIINRRIFPVAETRLIEMRGRLFLETRRFDRSGEYGRKSMISLQSIDAEFTGLGSNWPQVLNALFKKKMIREQDVFNAESLWYFGCLINNTDMHLGNLSLAIEGGVFRLLPLYDMCSMGFAPKSGGEVQPFAFVPTEPKSNSISTDLIKPMKEIARDFWESVAGDERISDEFKNYLQKGNPIDRM
ncbi:MAG: type II toxin-antitoxin system HipA family toxinoxin YjjJ [Deltaproteobacteria bacterium]|nr:MAG: type II toxin-antitoxin system HipA family toxinoxin YjjJ [Deltaproteobacteria bacterium]